MIEALPLADEIFVGAGYIRVYQDVRGKYGSEGPYLMISAAGETPDLTPLAPTTRPMRTTRSTGW